MALLGGRSQHEEGHGNSGCGGGLEHFGSYAGLEGVDEYVFPIAFSPVTDRRIQKMQGPVDNAPCEWQMALKSPPDSAENFGVKHALVDDAARCHVRAFLETLGQGAAAAVSPQWLRRVLARLKRAFKVGYRQPSTAVSVATVRTRGNRGATVDPLAQAPTAAKRDEPLVADLSLDEASVERAMAEAAAAWDAAADRFGSVRGLQD